MKELLEEGEISDSSEIIPQDEDPTKKKKKKTIITWANVRNYVKKDHLKPLFRERTKGYMVGSSCTDEGFMEFMRKKYMEVHGEALELENIPVFFVKLCYIEYFQGRNVDHQAVKESRTNKKKSTYEVHKRMKKLDSLRDLKFPKQSRSAEAQKRLKHVLGELKVTMERLEKAQARAEQAEKICKTRRECVGFVETHLDDLHGGPLGQVFDEDTRKKQCGLCEQKFTSEGWYRLGSCGHEYHMQCLLLHAYCERLCKVCHVEIPREFYMSIGQEFYMPRLEGSES